VLLKHQAAIDENMAFVVERAQNLKVDDAKKLADWGSAKVAALTAGAAAAKAASLGATPEQTDKPQEPEDITDAVTVDKAEVKEEEKKEK